MGPRSTALPIALLVGGCSILYNPNNITAPPADAAIDVVDTVPDADPAALTLVSVEPDSVVEGNGDDGSRMALLVVHGTNITSDAKVSIAPMDSGATPMVSSMPGQEAIAADHSLIAVPVTALVNTTCDTDSIDLVVTVTQAGGAVTQTIPWKLDCLPQVDESGSGAGSNQALPTGVNEYSRFVLAGSDTLTLASNPDLTKQLIVRVTGKLSLPAGIVVSASGTTPGPGGQPPATGDGRGGNGSVGGLLGIGKPDEGGGGAGYAGKGDQGTNNDTNSAGPPVGTDAIASFTTNYASGGGNYAVSGSNFNLGGAGGGTIELSAGGSLSVAGIASKGGAGDSNAGGGAGGTIVLRAGSTVTLNGNLDVGGGPGGGTLGGRGSSGRIRINAPAAPTGSGSPGTYYAGLAFDSDPSHVPYITRADHPMLLIHGTAGSSFDVYTLDASGQTQGMTTATFGATTKATISPAIQPGVDRICVVPSGASVAAEESAACVDLAYVP